MSVLIVANVVSGAVVAGYRRIGILKSIGFTPGQVVAAYAGQVTVPAVLGCLGGVVLGNVLAVPLLGQTANVYGVGALACRCGWTWPCRWRCAAWSASRRCCPRCGRDGSARSRRSRPGARPGPAAVTPRTAARQAGAAPAGDHRAGGAFRPPGARRGHAGRRLLGAVAVTSRSGSSASLGRVADGLSPCPNRAGTGLHPVGQPWRPWPAGVPVKRARRRPARPAEGRPGRQPPTAAQAQRAIEAALRAQPGTLHYVAPKPTRGQRRRAVRAGRG